MWGVLPAWALYARHAVAPDSRNFNARWTQQDQRSAMVFDDVSDLSLDAVNTTTGGSAPMLCLNNVMGALIRGARAGPAGLFLRVGGKSSRDIVLSGNGLRRR